MNLNNLHHICPTKLGREKIQAQIEHIRKDYPGLFWSSLRIGDAVCLDGSSRVRTIYWDDSQAVYFADGENANKERCYLADSCCDEIHLTTLEKVASGQIKVSAYRAQEMAKRRYQQIIQSRQ